MAVCPKCGRPLHIWNIKAECPGCNVNIPNYDWEGRLEQDSVNAEIAWVKFRKFTGNFKSALFGGKLRIVRFIFTFVPLILLVLPLANYSINLPLLSSSGKNFTLLDFSMNELTSLNWEGILSLCKSDFLGIPITLVLLSVVFLYLAIVFGVLNFVFVLACAPKLNAKANIVMCIASTVCFVVSPILFNIGINTLADTSITLLSGSSQYGIIVGIILFVINIVLNAIINKGFKKEIQKN
ncbi:MAG: hypothetical protein ACI4IF_02125 [Acutalibacteraceae bacterium]